MIRQLTNAHILYEIAENLLSRRLASIALQSDLLHVSGFSKPHIINAYLLLASDSPDSPFRRIQVRIPERYEFVCVHSK